MLLLAGTSHKLQVITSGAIPLDVHCSWVDKNASTITPDMLNTPISTATTTDVVPSPTSGTVRTIKSAFFRNRHATTAVVVTIVLTDGTNAMELFEVTLLAGDQLQYKEAAGFWVTDSQGRTKSNINNNGSGAAVNSTNLVVLAADVTNNNAVANTIADITGMSFAVTAGETYFFRASIMYTAAATGTGSRFSVNGPASPTLLQYRSEYSLTTTTRTLNDGLSAYDNPAASNATSATTGSNVAIVEGFIKPSANGTVTIRFASEVASSAIVAKAGSLLEWFRVL